jgi:hypothetical protein
MLNSGYPGLTPQNHESGEGSSVDFCADELEGWIAGLVLFSRGMAEVIVFDRNQAIL